ncbi:MAG: hypothetical protein Q9174_004443 [Haloplaca sp. 1 TL-2023]
MRLLNTTDLSFGEFFDSEIPKYAILSHRWGPREITFKDIRKRNAPPGPALRKIERCCRLARSRGIQWAWIDTCCIDDRSSAELSEAINSMYKWYQRSEVCFVFLSDVHFTSAEILEFKNLCSTGHYEGYKFSPVWSSFINSIWFTRGWTLQELFAPETVEFFDAEWSEIGTRRDLVSPISEATKILPHYLQGWDLSEISIATKMSFAAYRTTSREEDIAYCLLGLFDVNMPLLYGEGASNAFRRLQIEIISKSNDESIFAWKCEEPASGMLAPSPSCFADMGDVKKIDPFERGSMALIRRSTMSNLGLEFAVPRSLPKHGPIPVYLDCCRRKDLHQAMCIQLRVNDGIAFRVRCDFVTAADFPQSYNHCPVRELPNKMKDSRVIYVKEPDAVELEYSRILSEIEGGKIQFAKLPEVAVSRSERRFIDPGGRAPPALQATGRFIEEGECSLEVEANARWNTFEALMLTASDVVFSGEPRDKIVSQVEDSVTVPSVAVPVLNMDHDSLEKSDAPAATSKQTPPVSTGLTPEMGLKRKRSSSEMSTQALSPLAKLWEKQDPLDQKGDTFLHHE